MLAADKLQLQSALKQQATALKEKEFNLHHSNLMTVGTQAAVLAGLDITLFVEFQAPDDDRWPADYVLVARFLRCVYYGVIAGAFCANMLVVAHTTTLSVLGASLALRGPDGSMMTATDGLFEERRSVFTVFGYGLALTIGSLLVSVWLLLRWETALVCWCVALWTCRTMYANYRRVVERFDYDENETVDFADIMDGPAAIRAVPWVNKSIRRKKLALSKPSLSSPERGFDYSDHTETDVEMNPLLNGGDLIKRHRSGSGVLKRSPRGGEKKTVDYIQTV